MRSTPRALWRRRHLLGILVTSNLKRQSKNSALGYLWWLLDPMLLAAVYFVVFGLLFNRKGDQPFILFLLCGLLPWKAFADSVSQSVRSIVGQRGIIRAISFPHVVLPLSLTLSNVVFFLVGLAVPLAIGLAYGSRYDTWPTAYYALVPLLLFAQILFTVGVSLFVATLGVFFQDTANITSHVLRMWYFLSPGIYSIEMVPEHLRGLFRLNPFAGLMTGYRDALMFGRMPEAIDILYPLLAGALTLLAGYALFRRFEGRFVQRL